MVFGPGFSVFGNVATPNNRRQTSCVIDTSGKCLHDLFVLITMMIMRKFMLIINNYRSQLLQIIEEWFIQNMFVCIFCSINRPRMNQLQLTIWLELYCVMVNEIHGSELKLSLVSWCHKSRLMVVLPLQVRDEILQFIRAVDSWSHRFVTL